jgi:ADP-ribose pyrophosphatase
MFRATGCRQTANPRSDDLEETEILLLSRTELLAAIGRGEIHLLTQIALVAIANR